MSKIKKILAEKTPILMVSDSNYTTVTFSDGSKSLLSYCQKAIYERFGVKLKTVCRGVSAHPDFSEISTEGVKVLGQSFSFSRRLKKNWIAAAMVLFVWTQTTALAQVAMNDVYYDCKARSIVLTPMKNDTLTINENVLANVSVPTSGTLTPLSTKKLQFNWGSADSTQFQYRILDNETNFYSNYATVKVYGRNVQNFVGDYTNTANLIVNGCRMLNKGKWTIKSTAKVKLQSNTSVTLLPGAKIEAGAVVEIKIVRP